MARSEPARGRTTGRHQVLALEQTLLNAIASVAEAVAAFGSRGETQYERFCKNLVQPASGDLLRAMEVVARIVLFASDAGDRRSAERGRIDAVKRHALMPTGSYWLRAVRIRPGLFDSEASVLVIADSLCLESRDKERIRARFRLTDREADVALLLADRWSNGEVARALGISVHTARHHIERVLLKLGGCRRRHVRRLLSCAVDATEDTIDFATRISGSQKP